MYIPEHFRERDAEAIVAFMRRQSFATLLSRCDGALIASHLPLLWRPDPEPWGTLVGHMARANPQWQSFADREEALAIFQGPHAYISPSWYATAPAVPTWDYVAVHAYGAPRLIEDSAELRAIVSETVRTFEAGFDAPWRMEDLPEEFVERMLRAVVGFEIPLSRVEAKAKLSQNRSEADRRGVIATLESGGDSLGREVAELMGELLATPPSRSGRR